MVAGLILAASFLMTVLGNLDPALATVADLSPLTYYQGGQALDGVEWLWLGAQLAISVGFALIALWRFQKREIRVVGERGFGLPRLSLRRRRTAQQV